MIEFIIPGVPVAKGRARTGKNNIHYTPTKTKEYESLVKVSAYNAMHQREVMIYPIKLDILLCMPIPASWSKKKKHLAAIKQLLPTTKPDCDNVLKAIADGMNKIVYEDDKQIVSISMLKVYDSKPRSVVRVQEYVYSDF